MAETTKISWADATWSAVRAKVKQDAADIAANKGYTSLIHIAEKMAGRVGPHCEHMSPACKNCYSDSNNSRCLPVNGTGLPFDRRSRDLVDIFVDEKILLQPIKWRQPKRIFVCSQTDLFAEFVTDEMIDQVFAVMAMCPRHTFQLLTKRPDRMATYLSAPNRARSITHRALDVLRDPNDPLQWKKGFPERIQVSIPLKNVWCGTTCENQEWADKRIPDLLRTPAAQHFISYEPALGPVDIRKYLEPTWDTATGVDPWRNRLSWVIAGGESGRNARPSHPEWYRSIRGQCKAAGVPFLFKQWGTFRMGMKKALIVLNDGRFGQTTEEFDLETLNHWQEFQPTMMAPVGKKKAGNLLDGIQHLEFPVIRSNEGTN